jgi:hypothetical protein
MPDAMGHAKHFFDPEFADGQVNIKRDLIQYTNGSISAPQVEGIIIFSPTILNPYGHVAIVSNVFDESIQVIQQNAGPFSSSRDFYRLIKKDSHWYIAGKSTLGWLRMKDKSVVE